MWSIRIERISYGGPYSYMLAQGQQDRWQVMFGVRNSLYGSSEDADVTTITTSRYALKDGQHK